MEKSAFIIMPFTKAISINNKYKTLNKDDFDTIFETIEEILSGLGYAVKRSDSATNILRDIILDLDKSDLVVADLTSLNPNVMYELGIRHAFCKKTILLTQDLKELPFDISGYHCIQYSWVTNKQRKELSENIISTLKKLEVSEDPRYGPVHTYLDIKSNAIDELEKQQTVVKLDSLTEEIGYLMTSASTMCENVASEFDAISFNEGDITVDYSILDIEDLTSLNRLYDLNFSLPAIDRFLSEVYINHIFNSFNDISQLLSELRVIRNISLIPELTGRNILTLEALYNTVRKAFYHTHQVRYAVNNNITDQKILELPIEDIDTLTRYLDSQEAQ